MVYIDPEQRQDREDKLPQWAQHLVGQLRRTITHERELANQARLDTNPDETDTVIDPYERREVIGLPKGETVRFYVGPARRDQWLDVHVDRGDGGSISVTAADRLWISPQSGNSIRVGSTVWSTNFSEGARQ